MTTPSMSYARLAAMFAEQDRRREQATLTGLMQQSPRPDAVVDDAPDAVTVEGA